MHVLDDNSISHQKATSKTTKISHLLTPITHFKLAFDVYLRYKT